MGIYFFHLNRPAAGSISPGQHIAWEDNLLKKIDMKRTSEISECLPPNNPPTPPNNPPAPPNNPPEDPPAPPNNPPADPPLDNKLIPVTAETDINAMPKADLSAIKTLAIASQRSRFCSCSHNGRSEKENYKKCKPTQTVITNCYTNP